MYTESTTENYQPEQNLLDLELNLVRADTGKRLANYLIDVVAFYIFSFILGILIAIISPATGEQLASEAQSSIAERLVGLLLYALFMSAIEAITKGRSLGKLITGTKAVNLDGSSITPGTAFARGFSRAVPFCAFSAFGTPCDPWQDKWTNTMVIDIKKSTLD